MGKHGEIVAACSLLLSTAVAAAIYLGWDNSPYVYYDALEDPGLVLFHCLRIMEERKTVHGIRSFIVGFFEYGW